MAADPDNVNNLATDPSQRGILSRMRAALKQHTLENIDNGFLPEGSELEGYEASREPGAWPVERVFGMAYLASGREPANLPQFIAALDDPSEPIRWWAAQGCAMLRGDAATAGAALCKRLGDASGGVQIAAAEALAQSGKPHIALPVLERWIQNKDNPQSALQSANVLDRMGKAALPALPAMKSTLATAPRTAMGGYLARILHKTTVLLEGPD